MGDQELKYKTTIGEIPLFVREGSIIPTCNYALSTFLLDPSVLKLDVYTGKSGSFLLYEDDAVSEKYKTKNEMSVTEIVYRESPKSLIIKAARGEYTNAPARRSYQIKLHGLSGLQPVEVNGQRIKMVKGLPDKKNVIWSESSKTLIIDIDKQDVTTNVEIKLL